MTYIDANATQGKVKTQRKQRWQSKVSLVRKLSAYLFTEISSQINNVWINPTRDKLRLSVGVNTCLVFTL